MVGKFYPFANHGICIHPLIDNVVTYHKGNGVIGMVVKSSKAHRVDEFEKEFANICNINPARKTYLEDADMEKWASCHFWL